MKAQTVLLVLAVATAGLAGCVGDDSTGGASNDTGGPGGDPNAPLAALFDVSPATGDASTEFTFDASKATGPIAKYLWDLGDGTVLEGKTVKHTYAQSNGDYQATLSVVDGSGRTVSNRQIVTVGTVPNTPPVAAFTTTTRWVTPDAPIGVDASASTDADADPMTYAWYYKPMTSSGGGHDHGSGDAAAAPEPEPAVSTVNGQIHTGSLNPGQSFELTLTETGLYQMHCHPHPFMLSNVTVSDTATLEGTAYVDIYDFHFAPENIAVKPGTKIVYTNHGPAAPHTATQMGFRSLGGFGKTAEIKIPAVGAYELILAVKDVKGKVTETSIPVLVTEALPDAKIAKQEVGELAVVNPVDASANTKVFPLRLSYNVTDLSAVLTLTGETADVGKATLTLHKNDASSEALATGDPVETSPQTLAVGPLEAGSYFLKVTATQGFQMKFTIDITGTYVLEPRPEDLALYMTSSGGDDHGDAHAGH